MSETKLTDEHLKLAVQTGHAQRNAGFAAPDDRVFNCPACQAPGFNTGWGYSSFVCGAEITNGDEAEWSRECAALSKPSPLSEG